MQAFKIVLKLSAKGREQEWMRYAIDKSALTKQVEQLLEEQFPTGKLISIIALSKKEEQEFKNR